MIRLPPFVAVDVARAPGRLGMTAAGALLLLVVLASSPANAEPQPLLPIPQPRGIPRPPNSAAPPASNSRPADVGAPAHSSAAQANAPAGPLDAPAAAALETTHQQLPFSGLSPALLQDVAEMRSELAACLEGVDSVAALMDSSASCGQARRRAVEIQNRLRVERWTITDPRVAAELGLIQEAVEASAHWAATEESRRRAELPRVPFGRSAFALTMQLFTGLLRIQDASAGRRLSLMTGIGGGVKLRFDHVHRNRRQELVGLSAGLYVETKSGDAEDQTLCGVLMLSTFQYLYVGVGFRAVGTGPVGDGLAQRGFLLVGIGLDGQSLTD